MLVGAVVVVGTDVVLALVVEVGSVVVNKIGNNESVPSAKAI